MSSSTLFHLSLRTQRHEVELGTSPIRVLTAMLLALALDTAWAGDTLKQWFFATRGQEFVLPAIGANTGTDGLFAGLLDGRKSTNLTQDATAHGMDLTQIDQQGQRWLVLSEATGQQRGRGAYIVASWTRAAPKATRTSGGARFPAPVLLQAPHRFRDLDTGRLTLALIRTQPFAAAAWNTVPRDASAADGGTADLARRPDTDFVDFARAFANRYPGGRVVQVHGFAASKRRTAAAQAADMIVSNGTRKPDRKLEALFVCLREGFGDSVLLYPWDTTELGGTKNAVGRALRAMGFGGFVHLELSAKMRKRQLADSSARRAVADCIMDTAR